MLIAGWYFISHASLFQIKTFEINGLTIFSDEDFLNNIKPIILHNYITGLLGFTNYFVWPNDLDYSHKAIARINLTKDFWERKVVIQIEERGRYGIWCQNKECMWFDGAGNFFDTAPESEGYLLHQISGDKPESGMENILKALILLEEKNIAARNIIFSQTLQELEVTTPEGAKIIFSTRADPTTTFISAYESIVKKVGWNSINYLDLTVENRIYYR